MRTDEESDSYNTVIHRNCSNTETGAQRPIGCIRQKKMGTSSLHNLHPPCTHPPLEVRNAELYDYWCPNTHEAAPVRRTGAACVYNPNRFALPGGLIPRPRGSGAGRRRASPAFPVPERCRPAGRPSPRGPGSPPPGRSRHSRSRRPGSAWAP